VKATWQQADHAVDGLVDDFLDVDVMKFEVLAQLFGDGRLADSRRTENRHAHRLRANTTAARRTVATLIDRLID